MEKRAPAAAIAGGRTASKSWPSSSPGPVRLAVQRRGESDASGGGSCGVAGARSETFTVTGCDAGVRAPGRWRQCAWVGAPDMRRCFCEALRRGAERNSGNITKHESKSFALSPRSRQVWT
jgi:hypothetical protein